MWNAEMNSNLFMIICVSWSPLSLGTKQWTFLKYFQCSQCPSFDSNWVSFGTGSAEESLPVIFYNHQHYHYYYYYYYLLLLFLLLLLGWEPEGISIWSRGCCRSSWKWVSVFRVKINFFNISFYQYVFTFSTYYLVD